MLNDPSCSVHMFFKGKLQSLTKKSFMIVVEKNIAYFDHYNLIIEKVVLVENWYTSNIFKLISRFNNWIYF